MLFRSRTLEKPGPVRGEDSQEYLVDKIIDHKKIGKSNIKHLVRWVGYGPEDDQWISGRDLDNNEALDKYLEDNETVNKPLGISYIRKN